MKKFCCLTFAVTFALLLQGCFVTTTKYDSKTKEADMLRSALSESKKKNNALITEIEEIRKTVDSLSGELKITKSELSARGEEVERLQGTVEELQKRYDTTKISRETLISELLEKEKKYSIQIKDLTVENTKLENTVETLNGEVDALETRLASAEARSRELEELSSMVHLLEGRIARLKEEIADFLPLSGVRQKGAAALSETYSSRFMSRDISFLFASVPFEAALDSDGKKLSEDFHDFLTTLVELCENEKDCKIDIIATGRTHDGSLEFLNALKDKELVLIKALESFTASLDKRADFIRRQGRVTVIDKMGEKVTDRVDVNIYLVREQAG